MKIAHTEASLGWGGQEIRILDESRGMIERGHDVQLLCPSESCIFTEARRFGIPTVALPIGRKNLQGVWALRRWLAANQPDVVNTHSSTDSWLAALSATCSGFRPPIIRTRHISTRVSSNVQTRWLYTRATQHIVTTGEALRAQLIRDNGFPADRITSIPTGVDPSIFTPGNRVATRKNLGLPLSTQIIGIVATLRSWKGHQDLLEACAHLSGRNWHLLIVGDGPQRSHLERRTAELGIGDKVTFAGQSRTPQVWLQAMDVFALPSYANEGVPQALLQAMLTELPVVTTEIGAIPEIVQNMQTGLIVPPKSAAQLAEAIALLLDSPVLAQRLGSAARESVRVRYCRQRMLDDMENVFLNVCQ